MWRSVWMDYCSWQKNFPSYCFMLFWIVFLFQEAQEVFFLFVWNNNIQPVSKTSVFSSALNFCHFLCLLACWKRKFEELHSIYQKRSSLTRGSGGSFPAQLGAAPGSQGNDPLLTLTDTRGRLRLRYTLINGKSFLKANESLIRKHEAHPVPSKQEDVY